MTDEYQEIRSAVRELCAHFPAEYFRAIDEQRGYPEKFVDALTKAGWLAALIPEDYGGGGLSLAEASVIMEEINRVPSAKRNGPMIICEFSGVPWSPNEFRRKLKMVAEKAGVSQPTENVADPELEAEEAS